MAKAKAAAEATLAVEVPYSMRFTVRGTRPFLFSKPPEEMQAATGKAHVFSLIDMEKKVWRVNDGLGYAGEQLIKRLSVAGQSEPNPAPMGKGSAMGILRRSITCEAEVVPFTHDGKPVEEWDSIAKHWVGARHGGYAWRPLLEAGWTLDFGLACAYPEWFPPSKLISLVGRMGLIGIGDGTPLGYGRFQIINADTPEGIRWV